MDKKNILITTVLMSFVMVFAFYSNTIRYANAIEFSFVANVYAGASTQNASLVVDSQEKYYMYGSTGLSVISYDGDTIIANEVGAGAVSTGESHLAYAGGFIYTAGWNASHNIINKYSATTGEFITALTRSNPCGGNPITFTAITSDNSNTLYVVKSGGTGAVGSCATFVGVEIFTASSLVSIANYTGAPNAMTDVIYQSGNLYASSTGGRLQTFDISDTSWDSCDPDGTTANGLTSVEVTSTQVFLSNPASGRVYITDFDCSPVTTITVTNGRALDINSATGVLYVALASSTVVNLYNATDGSVIGAYTLEANPTGVRISEVFGKFFASTTTNNRMYYVLDSTPSGDNPDSEFCDLPENFNLLRCVLERNGSSGALTGTSTLLNQSSTNIMCQIGIFSCTQDENGNFTPENPDIKTNGVGYIFTVIAFAIMVGIFWVASRGDLTNIPTFVWFISTIGLLGALTAMEYLDPTFLIIGVVTIVAFAVAKAKGMFSGGQIFAGEAN